MGSSSNANNNKHQSIQEESQPLEIEGLNNSECIETKRIDDRALAKRTIWINAVYLEIYAFMKSKQNDERPTGGDVKWETKKERKIFDQIQMNGVAVVDRRIMIRAPAIFWIVELKWRGSDCWKSYFAILFNRHGFRI